MAGSPPNLHTMDSRSACIQGVLKVKGHVIRALLCWHKNGFFSRANGWITTKLAHDGHQVNLHPGCSQGQGQRSRDTHTFLDSWNELLHHWRSGLIINRPKAKIILTWVSRLSIFKNILCSWVNKLLWWEQVCLADCDCVCDHGRCNDRDQLSENVRTWTTF